MDMVQIKENVRSSQKEKGYICNGMCHAHLQVGVFGSISLALSLVRGQHLPRYTESGAFPSIFYCLSSWLFLSLSKIIYNFSNILNFFIIIWVCDQISISYNSLRYTFVVTKATSFQHKTSQYGIRK